MSYRTLKLHCKVCEAAKKPMNMVTSHSTRSRDGVTTCPTLLSQECKHCGKKGHTVKYCSKKIKEENNAKWVEEQESKYKDNKKANKKAAHILLASFNVLYESDDEDEEPKEETKSIKETKPKEAKPKETKPTKKFDWATAESDSEGDESESD